MAFILILAIGLFAVFALFVIALVVYEEETHLPWWQDAEHPGSDHGYHPAR